MTALNLPDPRTVTAGARTYVVWAASGGRILRLGELVRDERGNGGLAFERPEGFDRYTVIVTAESSAEAEHPGDPVLTTRADEAAALYPVPHVGPVPADAADSAKTDAPVNVDSSDKTPARDESPATVPAPPTPPPRAAPPPPPRAGASDAKRGVSASEVKRGGRVTPPAPASRRGAQAAGFYAEVEEALNATGGGRVVEFEGEGAASGASGAARTAYRTGRAYVLANFRGVPLPSAVGAAVYVLWAVLSDGRMVYMGSLPATEDLNRAEVYVRVAGFDADDYTLFVTAEPARPAPRPSEHRVLRPKNASFIVKCARAAARTPEGARVDETRAPFTSPAFVSPTPAVIK